MFESGLIAETMPCTPGSLVVREMMDTLGKAPVGRMFFADDVNTNAEFRVSIAARLIVGVRDMIVVLQLNHTAEYERMSRLRRVLRVVRLLKISKVRKIRVDGAMSDVQS